MHNMRSTVVCPTDCGTDTSNIADTYSCEMDDAAADDSVCEENEIHLPVTSTHCPPTDDCDCVGSWSDCTATCADQIFTISADRIGNVGNGQQCEASDGALDVCTSGEGSCTDVDCEGSWSSNTCTADCSDRIYDITVAAILDGRDCAASDDDAIFCLPGDGDCPLPPVQLDIIAVDTSVTEAVGAALNGMSAENDTPVVKISSEITFNADFSDVDRETFDASFKTSMASAVGGVSADAIVIDSVLSGSVVVGFYFLAPVSVQTEAASLLANVDTTGVSAMVGTSATSGSGTLTPVVQAVENTDCDGAYSRCAADCGDKEYTVFTQQSGLGAACGIAEGETTACVGGDGDCPAAVDCQGSYSTCDSDCEKLYTVGVPSSGQGQACEAADGSTADCSPGEGDCAAALGACNSVVCATPANQCREQNCNPATAQCDETDKAGPCDDGDAATTGETCTAGTCGGGTATSAGAPVANSSPSSQVPEAEAVGGGLMSKVLLILCVLLCLGAGAFVGIKKAAGGGSEGKGEEKEFDEEEQENPMVRAGGPSLNVHPSIPPSLHAPVGGRPVGLSVRSLLLCTCLFMNSCVVADPVLCCGCCRWKTRYRRRSV